MHTQGSLFVEIADIISRGLLVGTVMSAGPITKKETQFVISHFIKKKKVLGILS